MDQSRKLSIIIIVYAVEKYFRQCLDSVISQSYKNLEIILVLGLKNGQPVDGCAEIAKEYAKADERIKLIFCEAKGPADARNKGLEQVSGDLLGFVDSDDYIDADTFESMIKNLDEANAQISICGRYYEFVNASKSDSGSKIVLSASDALKMVISDGGFFLHCWDKIYTKEIFDGLHFPENSYVEDRIVVDKLLDKAQCIVYDPNPKYHFRERSGSVSKVAGVAKYNEEANRELIGFIKSKHPKLANECGRFYLYEMITCLQNELIADGGNEIIKDYQKKIKDIYLQEKTNPLISKKIRLKAFLAIYAKGILKIMTNRSKKSTDAELVRFE